MPAQTETSVQGAVWTTKYVDALPNSSFAWISPDGKTRKLPYKDADGKVDLPHVRNALARLNQTQGIPDDEKAKIRTKLQNALKSAKADGLDASSFHMTQTHSLLADATQAELSQLPNRVMLLRTGEFDPPKYWPFEITADDLREMKDNFELGIGLPGDGRTGMPVDFSHQAGGKAAAWIKGLEVEADNDGNATLWGTDIEWSSAGKAAVEGLEFKCLSADFWPRDWPSEWQSSEQAGLTAHNVIRGVALTNVPMFEGNDPMLASDERNGTKHVQSDRSGVDFVFVTNQKSKETSMNLDELRVKAADDLTGPEALFIAQNAGKLSDDERKKFGLEAAAVSDEDEKKKKEAEASAQAAAAEVTSAQAAALEAATKQIETLKASIDELRGAQKQNQHEKIQKEVEAHAVRGAIKPDQIEQFVTALEAADEPTAKALRASLSALADNPLVGREYGSSKTEGGAAMDIEAEVIKKAQERVSAAQAKGETLDIFTARKQVLASDAELAGRVRAAASNVMASFNPFRENWEGSEQLQGVNPEVRR